MPPALETSTSLRAAAGAHLTPPPLRRLDGALDPVRQMVSLIPGDLSQVRQACKLLQQAGADVESERWLAVRQTALRLLIDLRDSPFKPYNSEVPGLSLIITALRRGADQSHLKLNERLADQAMRPILALFNEYINDDVLSSSFAAYPLESKCLQLAEAMALLMPHLSEATRVEVLGALTQPVVGRDLEEAVCAFAAQVNGEGGRPTWRRWPPSRIQRRQPISEAVRLRFEEPMKICTKKATGFLQGAKSAVPYLFTHGLLSGPDGVKQELVEVYLRSPYPAAQEMGLQMLLIAKGSLPQTDAFYQYATAALDALPDAQRPLLGNAALRLAKQSPIGAWRDSAIHPLLENSWKTFGDDICNALAGDKTWGTRAFANEVARWLPKMPEATRHKVVRALIEAVDKRPHEAIHWAGIAGTKLSPDDVKRVMSAVLKVDSRPRLENRAFWLQTVEQLLEGLSEADARELGSTICRSVGGVLSDWLLAGALDETKMQEIVADMYRSRALKILGHTSLSSHQVDEVLIPLVRGLLQKSQGSSDWRHTYFSQIIGPILLVVTDLPATLRQPLIDFDRVAHMGKDKCGSRSICLALLLGCKDDSSKRAIIQAYKNLALTPKEVDQLTNLEAIFLEYLSWGKANIPQASAVRTLTEVVKHLPPEQVRTCWRALVQVLAAPTFDDDVWLQGDATYWNPKPLISHTVTLAQHVPDDTGAEVVAWALAGGGARLAALQGKAAKAYLAGLRESDCATGWRQAMFACCEAIIQGKASTSVLWHLTPRQSIRAVPGLPDLVLKAVGSTGHMDEDLARRWMPYASADGVAAYLDVFAPQQQDSAQRDGAEGSD